MWRKILTILLFSVIIPIYSQESSINKQASDILDFSDQNSKELRNDWKSYYGSLLFDGNSPSEECYYSKKEKRFLDPNCNLTLNDTHPLLNGKSGEPVKIPYSWKDSTLNTEKTNRGYGTFSYELNLPQKNHIAIYTRSEAFYSAFRIWGESEDGIELLYSRGVVSKNPEEEVPILSPIFFTYKNANWKRILVEVSNSHYNREVFWLPLSIGDAKTLESQKTFYNYREMIVSGILLMTGLYHLIIYFLRKQLRSTLWFGTTCILFSLRVLVMNRAIEQLIPNHSYYEILLRFEYIGLALIISSMCMYFYYFFYQIPNKSILIAIQVLYFLLSIYFLFSNPYNFTSLLIILQINILLSILYILLYLIKFSFSAKLETKFYARSLFLIYIIVSFCAIHDILMYQGLFRSIDLTGFGLSLFTIGQAYFIARMNSLAWSNSEYLSKKLEAEVQKQTQQLRKAKEKAEGALSDLRVSQSLLSRAESKAAMTQISAHLAHEINNPLNYISTGNLVIKNNLENLRNTLIEVTEGDDSAREFFLYCNDLITKSFNSLSDQNLGSKKINEMVSEIKAISGVDGFGFEMISLSTFLENEIEKVKDIHQKHILTINLGSEISTTTKFTTNRYIFSRAIRTISSVLIAKGAEEFSFEFSIMKNSDENHIYFFEFLADNLNSVIEPGIFSEKQRESGVGTMDLKIIKQILNEISININIHTRGKKQGFLLIIPEVYGSTQ
jgi:signal transduction histidine kinase